MGEKTLKWCHHWHLLAHAKAGLSNLYFAKLRSSLALLGVLVGTAAVVAMVLGGEMATNEALKQFKSLGTDLLAVSISSSNEDHDENNAHADLSLPQAFSFSLADKHILQVAPYTQLFHPVLYRGNPINSSILGVTDHFADMIHIKLSAGRFISILDRYQFYCVIGQGIYNQLKHISFTEPLGQTIQIGQNVFVIVGVAESVPENSFVYANIDTAILVPLLASTELSQYATINNIIFRLTPQANIPTVENKITGAINQIFADKQVTFRSAQELIAKMKKQSDILTLFLGLIGSISLLVGGVGVMNIMLVSVIERRREIGIRLAVGAKPRDIGILFLMEAMMLSIVGGMLGVLLGIGIAYLIAFFSHWSFILFLWPPVVGFSISVLVGIFFGFYPAYVATKLDPIAALRAE